MNDTDFSETPAEKLKITHSWQSIGVRGRGKKILHHHGTRHRTAYKASLYTATVEVILGCDPIH